MTKAERLEFMRRRFKSSKREIKPLKPRPKPYQRHYFSVGLFTWELNQHAKETRVEWLRRPQKRRERALGERRIKRVSALTRIAEKWPNRPRIYAFGGCKNRSIAPPSCSTVELD